MKSIVSACFILILANVSAQAQVAPISSFQQIYSALNNCNSECENLNFEFKTLFDLDEEINSIDPVVLKNLQSVSDHQADIWGDTIYEGEYAPKGDTELIVVEGVFSNHQLVAFRITYSQSAYDTGTCDLNWEDDEPNYEECTEGVITETSLVSVDYKEMEIDGDNYAQFND